MSVFSLTYLHISYQTIFFKCGLKTFFFFNYTDPSDPDSPHSFKQCYESLYVLTLFHTGEINKYLTRDKLSAP